MRVRWALEEVGQPYDVRLLSFDEMKQPGHRARHPFGQIPTYQAGDLTLFESGAIALHLAQTRPGLLPDDADAAERAVTWLFAALNTVEPPIVAREDADVQEKDEPWYAARRDLMDKRIAARLDDLTTRLGNRAWLDGAFSVGDLMMVMVLRRLDGMGIRERYPTLAAYVARGEARPAYARAFADQRAVFTRVSTTPL